MIHFARVRMVNEPFKTYWFIKLKRDNLQHLPHSKIYGANMGSIWGRQDPGGSHVGPMNSAIWDQKLEEEYAEPYHFEKCNEHMGQEVSSGDDLFDYHQLDLKYTFHWK